MSHAKDYFFKKVVSYPLLTLKTIMTKSFSESYQVIGVTSVHLYKENWIEIFQETDNVFINV